MRRGVDEEVAAAARRRLEQLRTELGLDALPAGEEEAPVVEVAGEGRAERPETVVAPSGRHLRRKVSAAQLAAGWVADRLPASLRGRVALGGRELSLILLVAIGGVAIAGVVVLRSGGGEVAPTPAAVVSAAPSALLTPQETPSPSADATPAARQVVVDVAGRVRRPGVLRLPQGSRVVDAIRRAGGARHGVDLSALNLARVLTDGEQVVVGAAGSDAAGATTPSGDGSTAAGPLVDLNTATEEQLETLPGVGPVTAQKILAWRQAHGAFTNVDELLEVDGIGDKTLADLTPYVTL